MSQRYHQSRQPLAELSNSANTLSASTKARAKARAVPEPPIHLPHNVSLEANGSLVPREGQSSSPEHHRVSKITSEEDPDSKRNSAVSATSTTASGRKRKTYIGHWQLGMTIGKGGCSRVRAVRHRYTQQHAAVKIVARSTAESTRAQSLANLVESTNGTVATSGFKPIPFALEREIALMRLLEHKNIVRLFDVWENRSELYLIMEFVNGGELFHYVEQRRGLKEVEAIVIFRQIVAALLYCHRLHICHRDLKPENILLNLENLEVKLIDFGMAALQPQGRLLTTPCGSPHYAAPEVVSAKPYDGKSADAWSCGVILYVMLTGTTPYNYARENDVRSLFADICRARYVMPAGLSVEAKDLIRRIFVPDPKQRINMDAIWDHPLLHKYDEQLGFVGPGGSKEAAIGPVPRLEDWRVKSADDIDHNILRNMRTLWHSEPESSLMDKLLNNDVNQEKIFYAALMKHREENLENYMGEYESMAYSASDYHHSHPVRAPVSLDKQSRSQSQYSIMNDEHLRVSHNFVESPPSVSSYDPYRSSRDPIASRNEYVNVVVHRQSSSNTNKTSLGASLRQHKSLRTSMLKHTNCGAYTSNSSLLRSGRSRSSLPRSSLSRHSLSTSNWPSSPPVISMKPSDVHKRGVSFNHIRRTSTPSALLSQASTRTTPVTPKAQEIYIKSAGKSNTLEVPSVSPDAAVDQVIRSKKERPAQTPRLRARKTSDTASQNVRSDIRKHSLELEKACQEAFFRDSISSATTRSPGSENAGPSSTPPSSVIATTPDMKDIIPARPLPDVPAIDTPTTYLARTLKEFRAKLAAYKPSGQQGDEEIGEVMKLIDGLVPAQNKQGKRLISAPEPRVPDHLGRGLPIISEESNTDVRSSKFRSFTAPFDKSRSKDETVRMVQPSSPASIAPLTIRKKFEDQDTSDHTNRLALPHNHLRRQRSHDTAVILEAIDENEPLPTKPLLGKKKSGWFGFVKKVSGGHDRSEPATHTNRASLVDGHPVGQDTSVSVVSSELAPRKKKATKRGLGKWLSQRGTDAVDVSEDETADSTAYHRSMESLFSTTSPSPSPHHPPANDKGRSWFARFLNIKPAQTLVCFNIPRSRARQELIILLREWQRHGVRDLQYSRETQTITARIDRDNSLGIKPVSFRIEVFVVLEHGRRVGLSIARFTQTKGAASAFRKVLDVVDGVMRSRNWLVEDEEQRKALCDIVEVQS